MEQSAIQRDGTNQEELNQNKPPNLISSSSSLGTKTAKKKKKKRKTFFPLFFFFKLWFFPGNGWNRALISRRQTSCFINS